MVQSNLAGVSNGHMQNPIIHRPTIPSSGYILRLSVSDFRLGGRFRRMFCLEDEAQKKKGDSNSHWVFMIQISIDTRKAGLLRIEGTAFTGIGISGERFVLAVLCVCG